MAIKKQNKRSLEDAAPVAAQNGSTSKKPQSPSKKVKREIQDNGAPVAKLQKIKKIEAKAVEQPLTKATMKQERAPLSPEKIAARKLKHAEQRAKRLANRKEGRKEGGGQYKPERTLMSVEQLQLRIDAILSRPELTKTAKRRLGVLRKRMQIAKDKITAESEGAATTPVKQESVVATKTAAAKGKPAKPGKEQQQKGKGKGAKQPIVKKEEPEENEEEEDDEEEDDEDEEDSNEEVDTSASELMNTTVEDEDDDEDDDEEEEEEDEDDEEEDEEAEEEEVALPVKKPKQEAMKKKPEEKKPFVKKENKKGNFDGPAANGDSQDGKKKRFVLFVGNLPYDANAEEIKKHFLTKVGDVANVRIPTKPGTSTPRGFAYVEVTNETDYEKGLSLHNTNLKGRRLNVEYTRGGSKSVSNRSDVVAKNKKLHAMRKQGMLAGSRKEGHSRNDRRQKARPSPA